MKNLTKPLSLLALLIVPGCAFAPSKHNAPPTPMAGWESGIGRPGAVLYGRDGSPVGTGTTPVATQHQNTDTLQGSAPVQPVISTTEAMPHRPEDAVGSRPVLLEMYQEVVTEKENLQMQLFETQQALQSSEDRILDLDQRIQAEIEARMLAEQGKQESEAQAVEMARRLAVAQMRRLEAEKMLLEKTLAERRKLAEEAQ